MKIVLIAGWESIESAVCLDSLLSSGYRPAGVILLRYSLKTKLKYLRYYFRSYDFGNFRQVLLRALKLRLGSAKVSPSSRKRYKKNSLSEIISAAGLSPVVVSGLNDAETVEALRKAGPDLVLAIGVGIIKSSLLEIPSIGFLNAHPGILPKYRGNNPVEWALLYGDPLGVTIHFMDKGIDTGDLVLCREYTAPLAGSVDRLRWELFEWGMNLMLEAIKLIEQGNYPRNPQESGLYWPQLPWVLRPVVEKRLAQRIEEQKGIK
ncbi:MAG TPA: formyl transferase [archaeon]|nr:formyl transferase [archaeon]